MQHHIRNSNVIDKDGVVDDSLLGWLCDSPLDVIGEATAKVLGEDRVSELAAAADEAGQYWSAACRWSASASVANIYRGKDAYGELSRMSMACLQKLKHVVGDDPAGGFTAMDKDHLETDVLRNILMLIQQEDLTTFADRIDYLLQVIRPNSNAFRGDWGH